VNAVIRTSRLGKRYRRTWALRDCTLAIPESRVVGLVGSNGAGKTTLLRLAAGLLAPTCGTISVLGQRPAAGPPQLARVGLVAQDTPVYARISVAGHLRLGAWLNPAWDDELARRRIAQAGHSFSLASSLTVTIGHRPGLGRRRRAWRAEWRHLSAGHAR
jgi:ABC-2 type transport system ATP-binding protein